MPSENHVRAALHCNDFQFGYVLVPVPWVHLSKQDGTDSVPVAVFLLVELGEKLQIPTETTHLYSAVFCKIHYCVHSSSGITCRWMC